MQNGKIPLAIWNAVQNDRSQREMVRALAEVALSDKPKEKGEILWVLERATAFEERRNNAMHTPFTFMIDAEGPQLTSKWITGHTRAQKLKGKDLLLEFEWYGRTANALAIYTRRMSLNLRDSNVMPWPDRPHLPVLGQ